MTRRYALATALSLASLPGCATSSAPAGATSSAPAGAPSTAPAPTLTPFGSAEALADYQRRMQEAWEAHIRRNPPLGTGTGGMLREPTIGYPPPRGEPVDATQTARPHEAGIVKATRDHLVILHGERLHTVRIAEGALQPVASVEAFAPESYGAGGPGSGILVGGDVVAVVEHSRGVVEVGLFRMDAAGGLAPRGRYQLRVGGGPDARAPAVRLVDGQLVVSTPLRAWVGDPAGIGPYLPAIRRSRPVGADTTWQPLLDPAHLYRPASPMRVIDGPTVHAVVVCDPARETLDCRATAVYAPVEFGHHVSATAVYVWTPVGRATYAGGEGPPAKVIYRVPLDGGAPTALRADGGPADPHSFDETPGGELHVFVTRGGRTSLARPQPEGHAPMALLRVPLSAFGDGTATAGEDAYRPLPNPGYTELRNRFVGDWLLYGSVSGPGTFGETETGIAFAARRDGSGEAVPLPLPARRFSGLLGFEPMGDGAVVVSESMDSLHYLPLRLGSRLQPGEPYARRTRWMGDVQARAEFSAGDGGFPDVLGIALSGFGATVSVLFLRDDGTRLHEAGELSASVPPGAECPQCGPYGFARPVFLRGRIFALVGGELVEGVMDGGRIRELRRVRLAPTETIPP